MVFLPTRNAQGHVPRRRPAVAVDDLEAEPVEPAVPWCHPPQQQGAIPGLGVPQELGTTPKTGIHVLGVGGVEHGHPLAVVVLVPDGHDAVGRCHLLGVAEGAGDNQAGAAGGLEGLGVGDPPGAQGCARENRDQGAGMSPFGDTLGTRHRCLRWKVGEEAGFGMNPPKRRFWGGEGGDNREKMDLLCLNNEEKGESDLSAARIYFLTPFPHPGSLSLLPWPGCPFVTLSLPVG